MNDKQLFQEIMEEIRQHIEKVAGQTRPPVVVMAEVTEEEAEILRKERQTPNVTISFEEPICMAKRIEELEAQVLVMAGLLREAMPYVKDCSDWGREHDCDLRDLIDAALSGKLPEPAVPSVPDGWQLVPMEPTQEMTDAALETPYYSGDMVSSTMNRAYRAMLASAPKPDPKP